MKTYKFLLYIFCLTMLVSLFANCTDDDANDKVVNIAVYADQLSVGTGNTKVISLKTNETLQLEIKVMPTNAKNKDLNFSIKGSSILNVSPTGLLTPIAVGTDTLIIEATDGSGAYVEYPVNIVTHLVKITSIVLTSDAINVELGKGNEYNLFDKFQINPTDAWDKSVEYISSDESILTVDENGIVTGIEFGEATVTIRAKDGSRIEAVSNFTIKDKVYRPVTYDRTDWTISVSHALPSEGGMNIPESLFDDNLGSTLGFLSMVKPGFSMEGITVAIDEEVYFLIDMKKKQEVDFFRYYHRHSNMILRFFALSIYGSDNGTDFIEVVKNVEIPKAREGGSATNDSGIVSIPSSTYRYYKVVFADWNTPTAEVGQISEFYLGHTVEE